MIEELNFYTRIMSLGAALMLIALFAASNVRAKLKLPMIGMTVGVVFYLINSTPLSGPNGWLDPWIDFLSLSTPFFIWLFGRTLFEREPSASVLKWVIPVLLVGWFLGNFTPELWIVGFLILHFVSLGLIADLVRVGVFERDDDLMEQRRLIRLWLPLLFAAQAGSILAFELVELTGLFDSRTPVTQMANTLIILVLMLFAGLAFLRTDDDLFEAIEREDGADPEATAPDLTPSEQVLYEKLTAAMDDGAYRTPGLTIAGLADMLDTPEHRLRALINRRLGHRNFSAFLNRYRIAEAKEKLADRADVDFPVLTIAMDLGYNSLPTFNRAFRTITGTTPSEYRRDAMKAIDLREPGDENRGDITVQN